MKSLLRKLIKVYFDKENKHWNRTIFVEFFEDDEPKLLELVRDYYKNMGMVEKIVVKDTSISDFVDLTQEFED